MITNFNKYTKFAKESNYSIRMNEDEGIGPIEREVMNINNMYFIDKIIEQLKHKKPTYRKIEEYSKNISLLEEDINKYKKYLAIDPYGINQNNYSYSLKLYVKTKAYNKLTEMLYGKGYKYPENDKPEDNTTIISSSWGKELKNKKAGLIFRKLWTYVDSYCDNAIEFLETGEISDAVKGFTSLIKEVIIDFAVVIVIAIIVGETGGGAIAIGAVDSAVVVDRVRKYGKYFKYTKDVISKLVRIIPRWWSRNKELITFLEKVQGASYFVEFTKHIPVLYESLMQFIKSEPMSSDMIDFSYFQTINTGSINKKNEINRIKSAIENHSLFNSGSLSNYTSYIINMPGWKEWNQSQKRKVKPEEFSYIFSYWISQYCWEFKLYLNELLLLMKIEDSIKDSKDIWEPLQKLEKLNKEKAKGEFKGKELMKMAEPKAPASVSTSVAR